MATWRQSHQEATGMTASDGSSSPDLRQDGELGEAVLGWAAIVAAAGAVLSWAACCVLPLSLALAGLSLGGLSWIAGQRTWITLIALGVIGAGWLVTWRRARMRGAGAAPFRLAT